MVWHSCNNCKVGERVNCASRSSIAVCFIALAFGIVPYSVVQSNDEPILKHSAIIVVGAPGEDEYADTFRAAARRWMEVCRANDIDVVLVDGTTGSTTEESDRDQILRWIDEKPAQERWIVLIGHGTSDRDATKFNLRGRDLSAEELAKSVAKHHASRWLIVHCGSSSGPWINALSGPNRVVITATKSGAEQNYTRFGEYLSQTISDPDSDLDHDASVSILEAFLAASKRVTQFYSDEDRIPSEQALLEDNNDKKGTPAVFYRGVRPIKSPADGLKLDGTLAARIQVATLKPQKEMTLGQRLELEQLEDQLEVLRAKKQEMEESRYYEAVESLFMEIIRVREIAS